MIVKSENDSIMYLDLGLFCAKAYGKTVKMLFDEESKTNDDIKVFVKLTKNAQEMKCTGDKKWNKERFSMLIDRIEEKIAEEKLLAEKKDGEPEFDTTKSQYPDDHPQTETPPTPESSPRSSPVQSTPVPHPSVPLPPLSPGEKPTLPSLVIP